MEQCNRRLKQQPTLMSLSNSCGSKRILRLQQEQKKQQELKKDTLGDINSFSPAKKQREEEAEHQVAVNTNAKAKKEVSPEKALQKLTDVENSDNLLGSSMCMLTKERKNELPKQRDSKLEEIDVKDNLQRQISLPKSKLTGAGFALVYPFA
ncbi:hypothetical protein ACLKA6_002189 [Drosophila palustris]